MTTPIGPSQVDIGNLVDPSYFVTMNPQLRRTVHTERRACSAMMMSTDPPTIFLSEDSSHKPKLLSEAEDPKLIENDKIFQMCKFERQERSASLPSSDISVSALV